MEEGEGGRESEGGGGAESQRSGQVVSPPWLGAVLQGALCHLFQRLALEADKANIDLAHKVNSLRSCMLTALPCTCTCIYLYNVHVY